MLQQTLVVLKPDAVERGLMGQIISRLERASLKITRMQMRRIDYDFAHAHYGDLEPRIGTEAYEAVCRFMQSGPVVAMQVEGDGAVAVVRKLIGSTMPADAAPGTIRGDFCHMGKQTGAQAVLNLVHASGTVDEAEAELTLWFGEAGA